MKFIAIFLSVILQCLRPIVSDQLLAVSAIITHGDTIPKKFYPNDPYQNPAIWQKPLGQLSNLGEQQSYAVGQWLKKRYDTKHPFISLHYNGSQTFTFSEDRDHSLMSGECIMAGLYPPVGDEIWKKGINWRPTPVHTSPLDVDCVIGRGVNCPRYNQELDKVKHGRFLRIRNRDEKALLDYLSENTGEKFEHIGQIPKLYEILTVEQNHNLTLPNWTLAVYPQALAKAVLEMSIMRTKNPELTILSIGPLYNKVQQQFEMISTGKRKVGGATGDVRQMKIFVGNSSIIYDTLHGLKATSVGVVPFGATLIFELWRANTNDSYVKLIYRSAPQPSTPIQQLKIGGCKSVKCPYAKFNNTISSLAADYLQWKALCDQEIGENSGNNNNL